MASDLKVNQTKIKAGCQSGRKVVPHDSKSDLPLNKNNNNKESLRTISSEWPYKMGEGS